MVKSALLPLLPALLLCQCATPPAAAPATDEGLDPVPFHRAEPASPAALSTVTIPVLRSPALERRWGKPRLKVPGDGSYALIYSKPGNRFENLMILGSPETFPVAGAPLPYPQSYDSTRMIRPEWEAPVSIAGKSVRYAQASDISGADPVEYHSETFSLTAPDGRTASYRFIATSNLEPADVAAYMRTARW